LSISIRKIALCPLLLICLAITGCAIKFPQIDRAVIALSQKADPLASILWEASVGPQKVELLSIATDSGNVFINKANVSLSFDGFIIRKIELFSESIRHVEFIDDHSLNSNGQLKRQIWSNYRPLVSLLCGPWQLKNAIESEQVCYLINESNGLSNVKDVAFKNRRVLNEKGELILLEQALGFDNQMLVLKKKIT